MAETLGIPHYVLDYEDRFRESVIDRFAQIEPKILLTVDGYRFNGKLLDMTAGNLSTHLRKLEDAGYVRQSKTHAGRKPVTYLALTPQGRRAFEDYTQALTGLLKGAGA